MAGRFSVDAVFRAVDRITGPVNRMQRGIGRFTRRAEMGFRRLDRVTSRVSRTLRTGLRRGLTVATAAIGITLASTNALANEADNLAKTTRDLQFPIEEYQEWGFAAKQAGIESNTFERSMEAMSRRMGQAQEQTGTLFSRLKDLHPEMLEGMLAADNNADALRVYREGLQGVEDPARRAAITAAVFSNAGQDMQRMAHLTGSELEQLMRTQRENGNVTQEQAEAAELFNDTVSELQGSLTGLLRDILLPMLPTLTELAKETREWVQANRELISTEINEFVERVIDNFDQVVTWIQRISTSLATFFAFQAAVKALTVAFTLLNLVMALNPIVWLVAAIVGAIAIIVSLGVWIYRVIDWSDLLTRAWGAFAGFFIGLWDNIVQTVQMVAALVRPIWDDVIAGFRSAWEGFAGFFTGIWEGIQSTVDTIAGGIQAVIDRVMGGIDRVRSGARAVGRFFGRGDDDDDEAAAMEPRGRGQTVSPAERTSREVSESIREDRGTVTIRDETGRAEQGPRDRVRGVDLVSSGAF